MSIRTRVPAALAGVALLGAACGGSAVIDRSSGGDAAGVPRPAASAAARPPQHHEEDRAWPSPPAYPDVTFEDPGVNPFVETERDDESTFAMDVDSASYTVARRYVGDGNLPDPASVRVEEYVNYFDQGYAAPVDDAFAIHLDGAPTPFMSHEADAVLRVGLQAQRPEEERPDAALTFVVDVSGSMAMEGRLELVKDALRLLVDELRPADSVAIVVYGDDARVLLEPTSAAEPEAIVSVIDSLRPEGSTNAEAGLRLGYDLAREGLRSGAINRVILASDGVANVGLTDARSILEQIERDADAGIELVTVGVGMGNFNDALLEQLADDGDGFYAYVDDIREAERLFEDRLTSTLQTVARDARVQVEFDRDLVERYRLLGFENRELRDEDFSDPDVDAGEVGAGHSVTALYELALTREGREALDAGRGRSLGTVRLMWLDPEDGEGRRLDAEIDAGAFSSSYDHASDHFRLAATVAAYAEVLRGSRWVDGLDLEEVAEHAFALQGRFRDADVDEFVRLVEDAARVGR